MDFYFPTEMPERIAFVSASITALVGLIIFLFPGFALRLAGFSVGGVTGNGYGATRSTGGLYLGLGASALLLAQNWTYLALAVSMGLAALGRLVSLVADRGLSPRNLVIILLQVALSAAPSVYVFGYL
jgi:hypothetical protein